MLSDGKQKKGGIHMLVGKRVKEERLRKGLSQQKLGDMINVTKVSICGYENNNRTPNLETLINLSKVLGVNVDYLIGSDVHVVAEDDAEYNLFLPKEDLEIIEEIHKEEKLYQKLLENPQRTLQIITKKLGL